MAEQLTAEVAGQVANNIEGVAEVTRQIDGRVVSFFFGGLGLGLGAGLFIGYTFGKRRSYRHAEKEMNESRDEYRKARDEYRAKMNIPTKPDIEQLVKKREERQKATQERPLKPPVPGVGEPISTSEQYEALKHINVTTPGWDYAAELEKRGDDPYVIHIDEFRQNEPEHSQTTVTYYEKDDVLLDEREQDLISDLDGVVGLNNLQLFGHGSGDPNVVYVRNDAIDSDFEICRNPGSYAEEVHGLKHSDEPGKRRRTPRGFDDE
jgi:hypothetical protein